MKLAIAIVATLLGLSPAGAVDFGQVIKNADGSAVEIKEGQKVPTLASISITALGASYADERDPQGRETITPEEKFQRGKLADKIGHSKGDLALSPEDLALLKKLIGKAFSPLIVAPAWSMLDPTLK